MYRAFTGFSGQQARRRAAADVLGRFNLDIIESNASSQAKISACNCRRLLHISSACLMQAADRQQDRGLYYQYDGKMSYASPSAFNNANPPPRQNRSRRNASVAEAQENGPADFLGIENITEQVSAFEQQRFFKPGRGFSVLHTNESQRQTDANQQAAKQQLAPSFDSTIYAAQFANRTAADLVDEQESMNIIDDVAPRKRNPKNPLEKRHERAELQRSLEIKFKLRPAEHNRQKLEYERQQQRAAQVADHPGPIENEPAMPPGTKPSSVLVTTFGEIRHDADNKASVFTLPTKDQSEEVQQNDMEAPRRLSRREARHAMSTNEPREEVGEMVNEVQHEIEPSAQEQRTMEEQPKVFKNPDRIASKSVATQMPLMPIKSITQTMHDESLLEPRAHKLTRHQPCQINPLPLRTKNHPQDNQTKFAFVRVDKSASNNAGASLTPALFEKAAAAANAAVSSATNGNKQPTARLSAFEWRNKLVEEAQKVAKQPKSLSSLDKLVAAAAPKPLPIENSSNILTAGNYDRPNSKQNPGNRRQINRDDEEDVYEEDFPRAPSNLPPPLPSVGGGNYRFPPPPAWMPKPIERPRGGQQQPWQRSPPNQRDYPKQRYDDAGVSVAAELVGSNDELNAEINANYADDAGEHADFAGKVQQNAAFNNSKESAFADENDLVAAEAEIIKQSQAPPEPSDKRFGDSRWKSFRDITRFWENPLLTDADVVEMLRQSIVYKDDELVAINKPYGMPVHGGPKVHYHVARYLSRLAALLSKRDADKTPPQLFLTHRIDRDATGVLLLARSEEMAQRVQSAFASHQVVKVYRCITRGAPQPARGVIDIPIEEAQKPHAGGARGRQILLPIKQEIWRNREEMPYNKSRQSVHVTKYFTLAENGNCALLDVECSTGHKHQVRVHLADAIRCPILGDHKYTEYDKMAPQRLPDDMLQSLGIPQAKVRHLPMHLHAYKLVLPEFMKDGQNLMIVARPPEWFVKDCSRLKLKAKFVLE